MNPFPLKTKNRGNLTCAPVLGQHQPGRLHADLVQQAAGIGLEFAEAQYCFAHRNDPIRTEFRWSRGWPSGNGLSNLASPSQSPGSLLNASHDR